MLGASVCMMYRSWRSWDGFGCQSVVLLVAAWGQICAPGAHRLRSYQLTDTRRQRRVPSGRATATTNRQ